MFPCCWINALLILLTSFGISFFKLSKEFIIFEIILGMLISIFFILRKVKKKKDGCCSKSKNQDSV